MAVNSWKLADITVHLFELRLDVAVVPHSAASFSKTGFQKSGGVSNSFVMACVFLRVKVLTPSRLIVGSPM